MPGGIPTVVSQPKRIRYFTVTLASRLRERDEPRGFVCLDRIAIIDHGRIVAQGTTKELKEQTNADSLEQAFLTLTGSSIRDEGADAADAMRQIAKMWSQKR